MAARAASSARVEMARFSEMENECAGVEPCVGTQRGNDRKPREQACARANAAVGLCGTALVELTVALPRVPCAWPSACSVLESYVDCGCGHVELFCSDTHFQIARSKTAGRDSVSLSEQRRSRISSRLVV